MGEIGYVGRMTVNEITRTATGSGWRKKVTDAVAPRVGRSRLPLDGGQARTLLGLLFIASSIRFVVKALSAPARSR